jgi:tetratricopeptide (TPR) repeat protein
MAMRTLFSPAESAGSTTSAKAVVEALYATGHWLFGLSRYADAATVFRAMVEVAPTDERSWLALAYCHQTVDHGVIALEMLGTGRVVAAPAPRCELARSRALRALGRIEEADEALEFAAEAAEQSENEEIAAAVRAERRN